MNTKVFVSCIMFLMKYFFDVEREITQQLLMTVHMRLIDAKDVFIYYTQYLNTHR